MDCFEKVAHVEEIPDGQGRCFEVGERLIAVFRCGQHFYAIDDQCPHMGASLSTGHLEQCVVTCPLHAWRFDVRDGTWRDNPRVAIDHFRVETRGDEIFVDPRPVRTNEPDEGQPVS